MCGFVAIFRPDRGPVDPSVLDRMTDAMAHRGPDGRGVLRGPGFGLGHRRLAIIDLEGGAQPIQGTDDRVAIAFNGEIYNYREVRDSLEGPWRTSSDTEVFLRAYEERGIAGHADLVGMWGAAIWDGRKERLVVSRDRLGIKPVYYTALSSGGWAFASEIRALLEHPDVNAELDPTALDELLTYRYVPAPRTLFAGIKKLPPAHVATATASGLAIERYWDVAPVPRTFADDEAEARFLDAFDRSVESRLVSDVPVGIFLSGGIDSSAILDAMHRRDVEAFTIGFENNEKDDEIRYAEETARLYGARHHAITIGPKDYAGYLDHYATTLEEPVLNDSAIATHFLSKLAREHVKVVLSGQGADEPLAGYDRFKGELLAPMVRHVPGFERFGALVERTRASEKVKRAFRSLSEPDDVARAIRIYAVFQEEQKRALFRPGFARAADVGGAVRRLHADVPHLSPLGRMLYTDTRMWLVDDLLLVADKLSMAHGLELRVPFLDHRLIELVESMPDEQKIRLTKRGIATKVVHRRAMGRRLPREILERKKRGFTNPMDRWLRLELASLVQDRLLGGGSPLSTWFEPAALQRLWDEHKRGTTDRRRQLFLLLTLDAWARSFLAART